MIDVSAALGFMYISCWGMFSMFNIPLWFGISLDFLLESSSWADSPLSSLFESFELLSTGAISPPKKSRTILVSGFSSYSSSLLSSRSSIAELEWPSSYPPESAFNKVWSMQMVEIFRSFFTWPESSAKFASVNPLFLRSVDEVEEDCYADAWSFPKFIGICMKLFGSFSEWNSYPLAIFNMEESTFKLLWAFDYSFNFGGIIKPLEFIAFSTLLYSTFEFYTFGIDIKEFDLFYPAWVFCPLLIWWLMFTLWPFGCN